jgi:hypothetical protein
LWPCPADSKPLRDGNPSYVEMLFENCFKYYRLA